MDDLEKTLNAEFCKECGIKKAVGYILNKDDHDIRFYSSPSSLYKKPSGWKNTETVKFKEPRYPDLINNPLNFSMVLNIQWQMFGELGDVYKKNGNETFEYNYIKTRLSAIKMAKSYGGGEMLDEYKKVLRDMFYDYSEWS
jgi:hypothetical protein